jgi:hypothetical protein
MMSGGADDVSLAPVQRPDRYRSSDRAEVRELPHVHPPDATDEEWERFHTEELDVHKAIVQARWLIRTARNPTADAAWPAVAASLRDMAELLRARIRCHAIRPDAVSLVDYTRHQLAIVDRLRSGRRA